MYWVIIYFVSLVALFAFFLVCVCQDLGPKFFAVAAIWSTLNIILFISLVAVKSNIEDKHDWYMETRVKYAEAEGIEKERIEMNDVTTYNLWYEKNKEDLENPWNFKSVSSCEFDYIKIGD